MRTILFVAALTVIGGCKGKDKDKAGAATGGSAGAKASACAGGEHKGPLTWFEDDYAAALACARATNRPLVVDMWAPWCHTCLSMSSTVLVDPSLAPLADRFVWAALDTDREKNAAVVGRFALQNWPTYFVLAPRTEVIAGRWLGAASVAQFRQFLKDGETAAAALDGGGALDPLVALVQRGDVAATGKDFTAAAAAYAEALAKAPADWPRRSDVLVAHLSALAKSKDTAACLAAATAGAEQTGTSANATDFLVWASVCADAEDADPAAAKAIREQTVAILTRLKADAAAPLSADDRSDLMLNLRDALDKLGRADEAKAVAAEQATFLDEAAAKATDPRVAMTFNWHRAEVYVYLGKPAAIVAALEQSAAALPDEYDPPYRLAWVQVKAGQLAEAKRWIDVAMTKAYGPRKVRVANLAVEIAKGLGDPAGERAARDALIATLTALPAEVAQPEALAKAQAERAAMDAPAAIDAGSAK